MGRLFSIASFTRSSTVAFNEFNLRSGSIFGEYDIKELTRGTRCPLAIIGANSFPEKPWHDNVYDDYDDGDDDDVDDDDD